MNLNKFFRVAIIMLLSIHQVNSQDTINIMHYNLLFFGLPVYGCNNSNNNPQDKIGYLNTITDFVNPDILTVNEMRVDPDDTSAVSLLLNEVLNDQFGANYRRANISNLAGSHIINMLYYNADKYTLYQQDAIAAYRDINIYTLYYNADELAMNQDTAFLHCVVFHLKSSQGEENEAIRDEMTSALMEYFETNNFGGNILVMGDYNIYSAQEQAFQNLINPENTTYQLFDPIESVGEWHNNEAYAAVHTQSTHVTSNNCASTGGMDDRFDMILMDRNIKDNLEHYRYIADSYTALGNNGNCFNEASLSCENTGLSDELRFALYYMSDHLPVTMKLLVDQNPQTMLIDIKNQNKNYLLINPVKEILHLEIKNFNEGIYNIIFNSMDGTAVFQFQTSEKKNQIPVQHLKKGDLYFENDRPPW